MKLQHNDVSNIVIGCAIDIHRRVGPGLFESVYEVLLAHAVSKLGLAVERQVVVPLVIDGIEFEEAFRVDLLIERSLVVEVKTSTANTPLYSKQVLTYLRLLNQPLGLVINFGGPMLKEGIDRVVNDFRINSSQPPSPTTPSRIRPRQST